ncbi:hypothetical protein HDU76_001807 [Blyttiomyces sp. JEL0837]|nr:hypothetical protein HDU76_001807 [Blyttiomyces sp. JEL0837]
MTTSPTDDRDIPSLQIIAMQTAMALDSSDIITNHIDTSETKPVAEVGSERNQSYGNKSNPARKEKGKDVPTKPIMTTITVDDVSPLHPPKDVETNTFQLFEEIDALEMSRKAKVGQSPAVENSDADPRQQQELQLQRQQQLDTMIKQHARSTSQQSNPIMRISDKHKDIIIEFRKAVHTNNIIRARQIFNDIKNSKSARSLTIEDYHLYILLLRRLGKEIPTDEDFDEDDIQISIIDQGQKKQTKKRKKDTIHIQQSNDNEIPRQQIRYNAPIAYEILSVISQMKKCLVQPTTPIYVMALTEFARIGDLDTVNALIKDHNSTFGSGSGTGKPGDGNGYERELQVAGRMRSYAASATDFPLAMKIWDEEVLGRWQSERDLRVRNSQLRLCLNALLRRAINLNLSDYVGLIKSLFKTHGVAWDDSTYNLFIFWESCALLRPDVGMDLVRRKMGKGMMVHVRNYNCVIDGFGRVGRVDEALKVFNEVTAWGKRNVDNFEDPNNATFELLMMGACKSNSLRGAFVVAGIPLQFGLQLTNMGWKKFAEVVVKYGNWKEFDRRYNVVFKKEADVHVYGRLVEALKNSTILDADGSHLVKMYRHYSARFDKPEKLGDDQLTASVFHGLTTNLQIDKAINLFNDLESRNLKLPVSVYNCIISYYTHKKDLDIAELWISKLRARTDLPPNLGTCVNIVKLYWSQGEPVNDRVVVVLDILREKANNLCGDLEERMSLIKEELQRSAGSGILISFLASIASNGHWKSGVEFAVRGDKLDNVVKFDPEEWKKKKQCFEYDIVSYTP